MTYAHTEFEVTASNGLGRETFTRKFNIQYVAQYPLHQYDLSSTKFEVATSNCLGGDTFTRKKHYLIVTLTLGSRSHEMLSSTLYSNMTYSATKFEVATSNRLGGDTFTRKYII